MHWWRTQLDEVQPSSTQHKQDGTALVYCCSSAVQLPRSALGIGSDDITPTTMVRDPGIIIDADLSMRSHVQRCVAVCFAVLSQLRSIRRSVPSSVFQTLVVASVLTKLDYGNATLAGLPANLLNRLQSVINAAARSIAGLHRSQHITLTVASFHWLHASERVKFKLAVLVYGALNSTAPRYLSEQLIRVGDMPPQPPRTRLHSSSSSQLAVHPSETDHLLLWVLVSGTVYWSTSQLLYHWKCFDVDWKHTYFGSGIQILFCSLLLVLLAMVQVLAVIYLCHFKHLYIM